MDKKMRFDTHGKDSHYKRYDGTICEVIGPLNELEYNIEVFGPMFKVKLHDGRVIDAFEDELQKL